ncbi:TPA: hypothetical protein ACH1KK_002035, partial [Streptococcus pneumoniae]
EKEILICDIIKRKGLHKKVGRTKIQRRQNRNQGGLAFRFMKGLVNFLGVIASGAIRDLWRYSC